MRLKKLTEAEIDHLEQCIPLLVAHASTVARLGALAAGHLVIEVQNGVLVLTEPCGK
jgi:hypothetical protein